MVAFGIVISGVLSAAVSIAVTMLMLRRTVAALQPGMGEEDVTTLIDTRVQPLADENTAQMARISEILTPLIAELRTMEEGRAEEISKWQAALSEHLKADLGENATKLDALASRLSDLEERFDPAALQQAIDQVSTDSGQLRETVDQQISQIRDEMQNQSADAGVSDQLQGLVERVKAAEAQLSDLMSQTVAASDQIGSAKSEAEAAQAGLAGVEERLSDIDARGTDASTRLEAALGEHAMASDKLADQVGALTARLETLERSLQDKPDEGCNDEVVPDMGQDNIAAPDPVPEVPAEDADHTDHGAGLAIETALSVPAGMISVMVDPSQSEGSEDEIEHRKAG